MSSTPRWFASLFLVTVLLAAPGRARADAGSPAPTPGQSQSLGQILTTPAGLSVATSIAASGLQATDPQQLQTILRTVSALDLTTHFHANQNMPATTVGPLTLSGGADVTVNAHVTRAPGQSTATLDSLEIDASGVTAGGVAVQKVTLDSNGVATVKLSSWIPTLTIKQVEHTSDGTTVLHTPWWMPNVKVKSDGTTSVLGFKVGTVSSQVFAHWPPSLDDIAQMASPSTTPTTTTATTTDPLKTLAGTLSWTAKASVDNNSVAIAGKVVQGNLTANVSGSANLANGRITTIGDTSTASLQVNVAPQTVGNATSGADVKDFALKLDGTYHLSVPLENASQLTADFSGHATYQLDGTNLKLALPNGAKVSVGSVDASADANVGLQIDGSKSVYQMTGDGTYTAHVKGPIQLENVGPVKSLAVDGTITSTGKESMTNGVVSFDGNATGDATTTENGVAQILEGEKGFPQGLAANATIDKGSTANVDVTDAKAAIALNLAPNAGAGVKDITTAFVGGSAAGTLNGQVGLADVTAKDGGANVAIKGDAQVGLNAPFAATVGPDGSPTLDPTKTNATVPVNLTLHPGSTVDYSGSGLATHFTVDREGSYVKVTGKLTLDAQGNPVVQEADDADVFLTLGPATATIGGKQISVPAEKTVKLQGRVVFRPNGLDVYGSLTVGIQGDATHPILSINY